MSFWRLSPQLEIVRWSYCNHYLLSLISSRLPDSFDVVKKLVTLSIVSTMLQCYNWQWVREEKLASWRSYWCFRWSWTKWYVKKQTLTNPGQMIGWTMVIRQQVLRLKRRCRQWLWQLWVLWQQRLGWWGQWVHRWEQVVEGRGRWSKGRGKWCILVKILFSSLFVE